MLPFRVFGKLQPRSGHPTALSPRPLLHPRHSTPFISNSFRTLSRNGRTSTSFLSIACRLFPSQWGCTPPCYFHRLPRLQSPRFPVVHRISLRSVTKCSSRNPFALTTIHFHVGCTPLPSFYRVKTDQEMTNFNCNNDPSRGHPRSSTRGQSSPCPPFASRPCNCLVDYSDSTFSMPIPAGCSFHPTERPRSQA